MPPAVHAAQHERAGREGSTRPALPLAGRVRKPASGTSHLTRSRPQDSTICIARRWPAQESPAGAGAIGLDLSSAADVALASFSKYDDPLQHSVPGIRLTAVNGALKAEVKDQRDRQPFLEVLFFNLVSLANRRIF